MSLADSTDDPLDRSGAPPHANALARRQNRANLAIDSAIVATLLLAAILAVRAYSNQHAFDRVVAAAYRSSSKADEVDRRFAMPESMRRAVPWLLARDSPPVLFDPARVSAQGLARRGVTHVLTAEATTRSTLREATASATPIDDFTLLTLDRAAALRESPPPGHRIVWLDSRPYRYRPLADGDVLEPGTDMVFDALLDPGQYEFRFDAFARNKGTVEVLVDLENAAARQYAIVQVADAPLLYSFEVPGDEPRHVAVHLRATIDEGRHRRVAFINRAELSRRP